MSMIENGHQYQWLTAYDRKNMTGHQLDWPGQPAFFKNYASCHTYTLPLPEKLPTASLFELAEKISAPSLKLSEKHPPIFCDRQTLAVLLLLTSAPTARSTFPQGEVWYRSNPSAGALQPLEIYLSLPRADDLPAGLYHYDLLKPGLNRLRHDSAAAAFAAAFGKSEAGDGFFSTLLVSGIFFRSAWKYRARAYRYLLLDAGHLLENLSLALTALGADYAVGLDFDDALINQSAGFDGEREVGLAVVRWRTASVSAADRVRLEADDPEPELRGSSRVSTREVYYPELKEIHQATSVPLRQPPDSGRSRPDFYSGLQDWHVIPAGVALPAPTFNYVDSLRRRRSQRNFIKSETPLAENVLHLLLEGLLPGGAQSSLPEPEIAFLAAGVSGLVDGLYFLDRLSGRYALFMKQDRRRLLAAAALDQRWLAQAALNFLFFADLEAAGERYGARSYRNLHIGAGRLGQSLYLRAAALGLGACAVGAFYDRELAEVCCLPKNFDPLYLVGVGPVAQGVHKL
ncbi:MAG: SagB family peptide dehydrogenase [Deltaproteobacteria bacterium]|nr:SagB family peptide dehydrogenase [Deltaproteobacteria bacterium]